MSPPSRRSRRGRPADLSHSAPSKDLHATRMAAQTPPPMRAGADHRAIRSCPSCRTRSLAWCATAPPKRSAAPRNRVGTHPRAAVIGWPRVLLTDALARPTVQLREPGAAHHVGPSSKRLFIPLESSVVGPLLPDRSCPKGLDAARWDRDGTMR
jgi:hypothetical protein